MMFDLRYHIASLTAVFLALGLGILVGITVVDDEALVNEQKYLIDRLEEEFRSIRGQNALLRQEIARQQQDMAVLEQFAQTALPYVIKDRLKGKRIAIVQTTGTPLPDGLAANLELAGAEIVSLIDLNTIFRQDDRPLKAIPEGEKDEAPMAIAGPVPEMVEMVWTWLSLPGEAAPEAGSIPLDAVIVLGGTATREDMLCEELDLPLISLLREKGIIVAGVEVSGMPYSYLPHYRKWADITVERVDTVYGQVALIWALMGFPGYYGTSGEAWGLLPPVDDA